jgi:hypothetical protein
MNNWFGKSECVSNIDKVKDFYNRVLADFLEKIYKENRFKMSGGLDEQKIDQLGEVMHPPCSKCAPTSRSQTCSSRSASI